MSNAIVQIYGRTECVTAQKTGPHDCDAECRENDHMFIHCFKSAPRLLGLPAGTVVVTPDGQRMRAKSRSIWMVD